MNREKKKMPHRRGKFVNKSRPWLGGAKVSIKGIKGLLMSKKPSHQIVGEKMGELRGMDKQDLLNNKKT